MLFLIKKILKSITDIGIKDNYDINKKFKIRFLNGLHFLLSIILLNSALFWYVIESEFFVTIKLLCLVLAVLGILLNKFFYHTLSTVLLYIYINFLIAFMITFYPEAVDGYIYYFPFAMVIGINNTAFFRDKTSILSALFSVVILILISIINLKELFALDYFLNITTKEVEWIRKFNFITSSICIAFFIAFYIWLSNHHIKEYNLLLQKEHALYQQLLSSLKQKEILLSEVHHRVKNNLAILNSMINMKLNSNDNESVNITLASLQNRIFNMSNIHNLLYTHENVENINVEDFVKKILHDSIKSTKISNLKIIENYDSIGKIKTSVLIPLGILLHEIISNAIHHTFLKCSNPILKINLYQHEENVILCIKDNGNGLSPNFKKGLGMELMYLLVEQLNGSLHLENDSGLKVKMSFPKQEILSN
ncbi:MAG: hypothetical protein KatS3mg027_1632 [Bacteroidia bacterium]|nr:MAG: hypothetical protein KatS3mg027_1632 [Bacteroidia bacterium]